MEKIIKRDGRIVPFLPICIKNAIRKALNSTNTNYDEYDLEIMVNKIVYRIDTTFTSSYPSVYDVEKIVENALMKSKFKEAAREYIGYRRHRDIIRNEHNIIFKKIKGLISGKDRDITAENANKDSKMIPVQRDLTAGIVAREIGVNYIMPTEIAENHEEGYIHYHDTDYSPLFQMYNCMLIDFKTMLNEGFKLGNAYISSPRSIGVATAVSAQIIAQVASHIYGGNTFNNIDLTLAPFVGMSFAKNFIDGLRFIEENNSEIINEKTKFFINNNGEKILIEHSNEDLKKKYPKSFKYAEYKTEKETYDAFQGLEYEINTLHTANGQTPFSTLGFGLGTSYESRLIQQSILKVRLEGLGDNKKTAIFPKLIFVLKKGLNREPSDPNYDIKQLALKCSVKRMYPDIVSYEKIVEFTGNFKFPIKFGRLI